MHFPASQPATSPPCTLSTFACEKNLNMPARGVSMEQDSRFKNKEDILLKTTKFPSILSERVDASKINMSVMRPWIAMRVEQMMGFDDDILVELVVSLLEADQFPDARKMQISLTGFLEQRAAPFMNELWRLLLSAQESVGGVPRAFVEQKKREMQATREQTSSVMSEFRRRQAPSASPGSSFQAHERRWDRGRSPIERRNSDAERSSSSLSRPSSWRHRAAPPSLRERDHGWGSRARMRRHSERDSESRYAEERDDFGRARRREESPEYSPPPARSRSASPGHDPQ